jgi:hypothetical protein
MTLSSVVRASHYGQAVQPMSRRPEDGGAMPLQTFAFHLKFGMVTTGAKVTGTAETIREVSYFMHHRKVEIHVIPGSSGDAST